MYRYFLSIICTILVIFTSPGIQAAEDIITESLDIKSVKVIDDKNILVVFSEAIDPDSVVLKVMKQSDNSTVKTNTIREVSDTPEAVEVRLDDSLSEASSYTLTVIAAIGKSGNTVTDGATALQDFVTPSPLKLSDDVELNAPSNPNAVTTQNDTTSDTTQSPTIKQNNELPKTPSEPMPVMTEELPLTGPSTYLYIVMALILAYFVIRKKYS